VRKAETEELPGLVDILFAAVPLRRDGILYPPPAAGLFDYAFPKRKYKSHE